MDERVVAITGASAGVGRATAEAFARRGARIGLIARSEAALHSTAKEVESLGGRPVVAPADVSDAEAVEPAARRIEEELGPIDVWVNNAMTSVFAPFMDIEPDEFERVTRVTYLGFVNGTRTALARMLERDRGTIVQVGSALAFRGIPLQSAYCGAKHAIVGFTESVRCELLHRGSNVHITAVHLPALNTPQFSWVKSRLPNEPMPVPPIYQPEVAADAVVWAAEHSRRRSISVTASTAATIVANKVAPGLLDRYLARTGYDAQQTDEPADPHRPSNLWEPVEGLHDTRGRFDRQSRRRSTQLWATKHRTWLAVAAGAALLGLGRRD